jgi:hypothetical protein
MRRTAPTKQIEILIYWNLRKCFMARTLSIPERRWRRSRSVRELSRCGGELS